MAPGRNRAAVLPWLNVCGRRIGLALRVTFICALLGTPVLAEEEESGPAIPPGQEELLAAMLGRGTPLAGDCRLSSGGVEYTIIRATYACPGGPVVFELAHPSQAGNTATPTKQFAITLKSGTPPGDMADAFVSLVRSREDDFKWTWPADSNEHAVDGDAEDEDGD